tara:strand:- start:85 stop:294 length:210 start_codon:yes stop_codon:yes gene_type:complete
MTLNEYRNLRGWSYSELARMAGAPHATVARRWCLPDSHPNHFKPSAKYLSKIMALSAGAVTPNDFWREI